MEAAVSYLTKDLRIPSEKLMAGIPFYGRLLEPSRGLGLPFPTKTLGSGAKVHDDAEFYKSGVAKRPLHEGNGSIPKEYPNATPFGESKLISYKNIIQLLSKSVYNSFWEPACEAEYAVNSEEPWLSTTSSFLTFESPRSLQSKMAFLKENKLGGVMAWELSLDLPFNNPLSLMKCVQRELAKEELDMSRNELCFPYSRWENVREQSQCKPKTRPARRGAKEQPSADDFDDFELLDYVLKFPSANIAKGFVEAKPQLSTGAGTDNPNETSTTTTTATLTKSRTELKPSEPATKTASISASIPTTTTTLSNLTTQTTHTRAAATAIHEKDT